MKLFIPVIQVFIVEERILRIMVLFKTVWTFTMVLLTLPRVFLRAISRKKISLFFLYLSFMNPHDICYGAGFDPRFPDKLRPHQIAATQKYINFRKTLSEEEYRNQIPPVPANMEPNGAYAEMKEIGSGSRSWTEEQWDFYRWMYCRLVEDVEKQIGRILTALADAGLADNTIVVFTSDHGEMGQSHGLVFKSQLLEEATAHHS